MHSILSPNIATLSCETPCQGWGGGVPHFPLLNFKTSRVGVYKCLSLLIGFAVTVEICSEGGCLLSRLHFTRCRYFLGHVHVCHVMANNQ